MNLKVLGQLHQRKIAPAPTLTLTLNQTLTLTGGVNVLRGQLSGLQHSYFRVNKITSFEEHLRTDASIRCYLDTINLKQSGCGTTCSFKILVSKQKYKNNLKTCESQKKYFTILL